MKAELSERSVSFGKRIDFHTHILPQMDDGSTSVEMSRHMIAASVKQGVSAIVLTPHFYPSRDNPQHFLAKRKAKFELLQSGLRSEKPLLLQGAEVQYFEGLVSMRELPYMRIGNTTALMIEMPMGPWSNRAVNDIADLNRQKEYRVILAHVERYLPFGNLPAMQKLASSGVHMQVSADAFSGFWASRRMLKMLDDGLVHILGSDCHNLTSRPPNLSDAYRYIESKRGSAAASAIIHHGLKLLSSRSDDRANI